MTRTCHIECIETKTSDIPSSLTQILCVTHTYAPSLKIPGKLVDALYHPKKYMSSCNHKRARLGRKLSTAVIYGEELLGLPISVSIESENRSASLWVTHYFTAYNHFLADEMLASLSLFCCSFNKKVFRMNFIPF